MVDARRSSEADRGADDVRQVLRHSAVGLREASAPGPVRLHECEVLGGHHAARRVLLQRREQFGTERPLLNGILGGRVLFVEVGEQRYLRRCIMHGPGSTRT